MKTSIKTALLFSTLMFSAVEVPAFTQPQYGTQVVAHAATDDTNDSNIAKIKDNTVKQIILQSVNNNEGKNYSSADQITNDDLMNLTTISYNGDGSKSVKSLEGFNTESMPNLTSVTITNVDVSSISDLTPFTRWNNLASLDLSGDKISSAQVSSLGQWSDSSLTNLDFSNNSIGNLDFLQNISIPNVQTINVSHNQISDFSPVKNQNWTKLTSLNADFNNISDITPISEVNWTSLQTLSVNNNHISDISPIASANWPNLQVLSANNNNISDINSFANTNWHNLTTISASGNHISNVSSLKNKSSNFPNLTNFYVSNNNINDISWMSGYKFDSSSNAKKEVINANVNVVKTNDGKPVYIQLPITINDVSLDGNLLASADTNGQNIIVDNKYLDQDGGNYNQNGTLIDSSSLVGNDNQEYAIHTDDNGNQNSNGVAGIKLNSDTGSKKYTFGFTSNLGRGYTGYFYGAYNLNVNWGSTVSKSKSVNVTVKYVDQNGHEISAPQTKTISFTETGFQPDDASQQITWNNDWKNVDGTSYSFNSPTIQGFEDPSETQVSGTVTNDSNDVVKTVTYKTIPAPNSTSSSENKQSQSSASSSSSSADQSSSASIEQTSSSNASNESKAASSSSVTSSSSSAVESSVTPAETSSSTSVQSSHSNNKGTPKKDNVQPKKVETKNSSEHKDTKSLPQTGDETNQKSLIALGTVAIAAALGLALFSLRRKNK